MYKRLSHSTVSVSFILSLTRSMQFSFSKIKFQVLVGKPKKCLIKTSFGERQRERNEKRALYLLFVYQQKIGFVFVFVSVSVSASASSSYVCMWNGSCCYEQCCGLIDSVHNTCVGAESWMRFDVSVCVYACASVCVKWVRKCECCSFACGTFFLSMIHEYIQFLNISSMLFANISLSLSQLRLTLLSSAYCMCDKVDLLSTIRLNFRARQNVKHYEANEFDTKYCPMWVHAFLCLFGWLFGTSLLMSAICFVCCVLCCTNSRSSI